MRYTLLVLSPPDIGSSNRHALGFARAVIAAGHTLECVFFFDAGALTALSDTEAPQDEDDLRSHWQALASEAHTTLQVCVASAARFGLADPVNKERLLSGFGIAGLGALAEAQLSSDRLLSFAD